MQWHRQLVQHAPHGHESVVIESSRALASSAREAVLQSMNRPLVNRQLANRQPANTQPVNKQTLLLLLLRLLLLPLLLLWMPARTY